METLSQDLGYALRRMARSPVFTGVAVLSLALGIGANTAIFTLVNSFLLKRVPIPRADEVVEIYTQGSSGALYSTSSYPDFAAIRDLDVFSEVTAYNPAVFRRNLDDRIELTLAELVTGNYFNMLGVQAVLGRTLGVGDDVTPGGHPVVMIGYGFWQREYGGATDVVGQTIRLGGNPYTIVGVAPESFKGLFPVIVPEMWGPMAMANQLLPSGSDRLTNRGSRNLMLKGRLAAGIMPERAQAALSALAASVAEEFPRSNGDRTMTLVPTLDVNIHPGADKVLFPVAGLLMSVVGLVLLIACANLASFLLARAADRRKEIAVRLALGASRGTLVRQLLTETMLLALMGGVAGLVAARFIVQAILTFQPPVPIPLSLDLGLDKTVLGFSLGISLAAGVLFGLAPALQATKPDLAPTLKHEGAVGGRRRWYSLSNALVVIQVAFSLVLLVASGLFLRSLRESQAVDPGFGAEPAAVISLNLPAQQYTDDELRAFYNAVTERTSALAGVRAVGLTDLLPLGGLSNQMMAIVVDGIEPPPGEETHLVDFVVTSAGYFDAVGVPLLSGRAFRAGDGDEGVSSVIVSETMARRFWPGEDPLGKELYPGTTRETASTVVGVARDTKIRSIGEGPTPYLYVPFQANPREMMQVIVKTTGAPTAVMQRVRAIARELESDVVVLESKTMEEHLAFTLFATRMAALLLSVFGGLALALAVVGLYGVVSYTVSRRTREVGIRMSLGAESMDVVRLVMKGGLALVAVGVVVGLTLAVGAGQLIQSYLFGVSSTDVTTFVGVPVVFVLIAALASFFPARRASRVDPVNALRSE